MPSVWPSPIQYKLRYKISLGSKLMSVKATAGTAAGKPGFTFDLSAIARRPEFGALIGAVALGGWFVQNAYSSGPPDLVIAGLTVIDPLVAVSIGIVILGEAKSADFLTILGWLISAIVAVIGVYLLSKVHPELSTKVRSRKHLV